VSDEFVEEMRQRYGEDSNAFRIRVLGEFPMADDDTVIPYHLADAARHRDIERSPEEKPVWALDVARFGSDSTVLLKRAGSVVYEIMVWNGVDLMGTVGRVKAEFDALPSSKRPQVILVDSIGLGAGVVDRLRELGAPVRGVNVAEAPSAKGTYTNLRSELWFRVKGWLEDRGCKLPDNDRLIAELTSVRYRYMSSGKMAVESKDEMRKRGLKSPDLADALCLSLAVDDAVMLGGSKMLSWAAPLRRNLRGVA
jgi:hypothetical protein